MEHRPKILRMYYAIFSKNVPKVGGEDKRAKSSDHVWHQMECSLGQNKQLLLNTFVYIFEKSIDRL